jgi:NhaA family Na+:H+ antiporter
VREESIGAAAPGGEPKAPGVEARPSEPPVASHPDGLRLLRDVDLGRDHARGTLGTDAIVLVGYFDFLCPYCRRLRQVLRRLRQTLGDRLVYVFRHFPNERAHPGAELVARAAEAAGRQGRFFEMHDLVFDRELPIGPSDLVELARQIGLDGDRFARDLEDDQVRARIEQDLEDGRQNGVIGTPTLFVDRVRYDGAWDYHSLLEALERPIAARVERSARVFASLPTSAALLLITTAAFALLWANTPFAPLYHRLMEAKLGVEAFGKTLSFSVRDWLAEGPLSIFFLLVGLEIRRELTRGALASVRAALLPVLAAMAGVVMPALVYLALNRGPSAHGWSIPTATDVAFSLGLLAAQGDRIPVGLRVFVAALAVVDDVLSVFTLAVFYPHDFAPVYAVAVAACVLVLFALNRARVYAIWPYLALGSALWLACHALGVHAALAGIVLAACLPTRPVPKATPLLAQAATALAALEHAENEAREGRLAPELEREPLWEWAARNLSAASERFMSPAERIERFVAPWSAYVVLPAFALSATGVPLTTHFDSPSAPAIFAGVTLGLVLGKPLGVLSAVTLALVSGVAVAPEGVTRRDFLAAACLCGVGDTMALLMADRAFVPDEASVAKLGVLCGSVLAAVLGTLVLSRRASGATPSSA